METKVNHVETTGLSINDELMKVVIEKVTENTSAIRENNMQIGSLTGAVGELSGVGQTLEAMEGKFVSVSEGLDSMARMVSRITVLPEAIRGLAETLKRHTEFFERPVKKEIHHKHFLGWPVVVLFLMGCGVVLSIVITVNAHERADQYGASDIKLRWLKLVKDSVLLRAVFAADKQYEDNPDQFRNDVVAEEERREALTEKLLEMNEKKGEIEQLEKEEKKQKK
jgi:hypothetical protein